MTQYDVTTKHAPAAVLASLETTLGTSAEETSSQVYAETFGRLFADLDAALLAAGVKATGPAWSIYDRSEDDGQRVAAAFPVSPRATLPPGVTRREAAEQEVAYTVHLGTVDGIGAGYQALMAWIEASGLKVAGGARDLSLVWDPEHPDRNVTELQIPVAR